MVCERAVWAGQVVTFDMFQVRCWWGGGLRRCHTLVTSGTKHCGTQQIRRDDFCMSAGGEGRAGTGEHGFSLTGGEVVAGSNPVSPTKEVAGKAVLMPRRTGDRIP